MSLGSLVLVALVACAVVPLLLLLVWTIADRCGFAFADRLLDVAARAMIVQAGIGALFSIVGGMALVALGVWAFGSMPWPHRLVGLICAPYGAWRLWRGVRMLGPG